MADLHFSRRVGAAGDVAELEYVVALMRTEVPKAPSLLPCAAKTVDETTASLTAPTHHSVSSTDVLRFLRSRYNLAQQHQRKHNHHNDNHHNGGGGGLSRDGAVHLVRSLAGRNCVRRDSRNFKDDNGESESSNNSRKKKKKKKATTRADTDDKPPTEEGIPKKKNFAECLLSPSPTGGASSSGGGGGGGNHQGGGPHLLPSLSSPHHATSGATSSGSGREGRRHLLPATLLHPRGVVAGSDGEVDDEVSGEEVDLDEFWDKIEQEREKLKTVAKDVAVGVGLTVAAEEATEKDRCDHNSTTDDDDQGGEMAVPVDSGNVNENNVGRKDQQGEKEDSMTTTTTTPPLEEYLDLVQLVSLLLIPTFAKVADEHENGGPRYPPQPRSYEEIPAYRKGGCCMLEPALKPAVNAYQRRRARYERDLYEAHRPQPTDQLPGVLRRLWLAQAGYDAADEGELSSPRIDEEFVANLLIAFGEHEYAENPVLVREMVEAARSETGSFDEEAIVSALSYDVLEHWEVGCEDKFTSCFEDVFGAPDNRTRVTELAAEGEATDDAPDAASPDEENNNNSDDGGVPKAAESGGSVPPAQHEHPNNQCTLRCVIKSVVGLLSLVGTLLFYLWKAAWCFGYCAPRRERRKVFEVEPSNIDMVLDAHTSIVVLVFIWIFFLLTYTHHFGLPTFSVPNLALEYSIVPLPECQSTGFLCNFLIEILRWIILAVFFSFVGIIFLTPISFGNNPYKRCFIRALLSLIVAAAYTLFPYVAVRYWAANNPKWQETDYGGQLIGEWNYELFMWITLGWGCALCLLLLVRLVHFQCCLDKCFNSLPGDFFKRAFSSYARCAEVNQKRAATKKINKMLLNAWTLHDSHPFGLDIAHLKPKKAIHYHKPSSEALLRYNQEGEIFETAGGILWTLKHIFDGSLFHTEGVWLPSRLVWTQVAQVILAGFYAWLLYGTVEVLVDKTEEVNNDFNSKLEQLNEIMDTDFYADFIPTPFMISASFYPSWVISMVMGVITILLYVPSTVSTTLKFRCQFYPSSRTKRFEIYRQTVDYVYRNSSNALWGLLGSMTVFYTVFAVVIFVFLWPPTKDWMMKFLGFLVGVGVTVFVKMQFMKTHRKAQYRCFYRIYPQVASMLSLGMEGWYVIAGGTFMISRVIQLVFATAFWIGRVDTQFLSEEVSILGYRFDYAPQYFKKDILVHEAHHHPYVERLGTIYLMKLRHPGFIKDAGSVWRQLAVMAFMPWLQRYRIFEEKRRKVAREEPHRIRRRRRCFRRKNRGLQQDSNFTSSGAPPGNANDGDDESCLAAEPAAPSAASTTGASSKNANTTRGGANGSPTPGEQWHIMVDL